MIVRLISSQLANLRKIYAKVRGKVGNLEHKSHTKVRSNLGAVARR